MKRRICFPILCLLLLVFAVSGNKTIHTEGAADLAKVTVSRSISLKINEKKLLKVKKVPKKANVTYTSQNHTIASIDSNGYVKGKKQGRTTITVKIMHAKKSITRKCSIVVIKNTKKTDMKTEPKAKAESKSDTNTQSKSDTNTDTKSDTNTSTKTDINTDIYSTTINILVKNRILTATLVQNSSAKALLEMLADGPVTIQMSDYANMEKVGQLPQSLPRNDEQIHTDFGDLILYQGNSFVIYYDQNSWNLTRLGKIENISKAELKKLLGDGSVSITLSLPVN